MIPATTITTKGQVTIPEAVRLQLGITPGDMVRFTRVVPSTKEASFRIVRRMSIDELAGSLKTSVGYIPNAKARTIAAKALGKRYTI